MGRRGQDCLCLRLDRYRALRLGCPPPGPPAPALSPPRLPPAGFPPGELPLLPPAFPFPVPALPASPDLPSLPFPPRAPSGPPFPPCRLSRRHRRRHRGLRRHRLWRLSRRHRRRHRGLRRHRLWRLPPPSPSPPRPPPPSPLASATALATAASAAIATTSSTSIAPRAITALGEGCPIEDGQARAMTEVKLNPKGKSGSGACYRNEDMSPPTCHDHLMTASNARLRKLQRGEVVNGGRPVGAQRGTLKVQPLPYSI